VLLLIILLQHGGGLQALHLPLQRGHLRPQRCLHHSRATAQVLLLEELLGWLLRCAAATRPSQPSAAHISAARLFALAR
jgi:hypothetical protein